MKILYVKDTFTKVFVKLKNSEGDIQEYAHTNTNHNIYLARFYESTKKSFLNPIRYNLSFARVIAVYNQRR